MHFEIAISCTHMYLCKNSISGGCKYVKGLSCCCISKYSRNYSHDYKTNIWNGFSIELCIWYGFFFRIMHLKWIFLQNYAFKMDFSIKSCIWNIFSYIIMHLKWILLQNYAFEMDFSIQLCISNGISIELII